MANRSKSGQKRRRHEIHQRLKRRLKAKRAQLLADGKIKKGIAPVSSSATA